jgi:hypothetical protein
MGGVVRVPGRCGIEERELGRLYLAEHDRAGSLRGCDDLGVGAGIPAARSASAVAQSWDALDINDVFDPDRDAVKRSAQHACCCFLFASVRFRESAFLVDLDPRHHLTVDLLNARQAALNQFDGR